MPVVRGVGVGECTRDKEDGFAKYIMLHARIVRSVWYRSRPSGWTPGFQKYVYIDTHSGSGDNGPYGPGSPVLFLAAMERFGIPFVAHFIEREAQNAEALRKLVRDNGCEASVTVHEADNTEAIGPILDSIPRDAYGLLYMDPNGLPDVSMLSLVATRLRKLDILVRDPARAHKRVRVAHDKQTYLTDIITGVGKERWLVRAPLPTDHQMDWVFLFGTNYSDWGEWKRERFYRVDGQEGQQILSNLNLTDAEREAIQQPMLGMMDAVNTRSGGVCEKCLQRPATENHHLRYGGDHDPEKVIHVCHECHCLIEGKAT